VVGIPLLLLDAQTGSKVDEGLVQTLWHWLKRQLQDLTAPEVHVAYKQQASEHIIVNLKNMNYVDKLHTRSRLQAFYECSNPASQ